MSSTLNPACRLCGLRFGNRPLLDLHIREDHQYVLRAQDGHNDPGITRATASRDDGPPHGRDQPSTPPRTMKEATAGTTRRRLRAGRAVTTLYRALSAVRYGNDGLLRAPGAVIRFARAQLARLQIPALPARQPQKVQGRTAAERADRDDCLICRASFPL